MASSALTDKAVAAAHSNGKPQKDFFDGLVKGLSLRAGADGRKAWCFTYTSPATQKRTRLTIGTYPAKSLKEAREAAVAFKGQVESGVDPRTEQTNTLKPKTVNDLITERMASHVNGKLRSADQVAQRYKTYVSPLIGDVPVAALQKSHLYAVTDPIIQRGKAHQAARVYQDLSALANFAVRRGYLLVSPFAKADVQTTFQPRDRFLSLDEIVRLWQALPTVLAESPTTVSVLKLCLITGQRLSEVSGIARDEVNWDDRIWTIPVARSKNGKAHVVPLSSLALTIIRPAMKAAMKDEAHYLLRHTAADKPLSHHLVDRAVARANRVTKDRPAGRFNMPKWRPHDLRRTVATHMSISENGLDIPEHHISQVLNHRTETERSITARVYNRNNYLAEKRAALEKWAAFLERLVDPHKVVQINPAKQA